MTKILAGVLLSVLVVGVIIWVVNVSIGPGAGTTAEDVETKITTNCVNRTTGAIGSTGC